MGFERAYARWHRLRTYDRPGTWVYVVALRYGRSQLRPREIGGPATEMLGGDHSQTSVDRLTTIEQVMSLPPQQRAVVVLRHLAGLQLAEALGLKLGTVKSTLHAAHARLRVLMEQNEDVVEVRDAR